MTAPTPYKPAARVLHWLTAILVIATFPVGLTMVQEGLARGTQDMLYIFHKNVGVIILLLVLARLAYRVANPAPPLPDHMPGWQKTVAHLTHGLLYGLVIVMAVSGYIRVKAAGFPLEGLDALGVPSLVPSSKTLAETAKGVHGTARFALFALILMHVGAAAYHGLVKRDGVFSRMWRG
ncbi:MAG: cytochrome b [Gemmobacter sp.]